MKKKLDEQAYKNLREVRDDLNLIFRNAKTYNMKESGIYVDAQTLQVHIEHVILISTNLRIIEVVIRGVAEYYGNRRPGSRNRQGRCGTSTCGEQPGSSGGPYDRNNCQIDAVNGSRVGRHIPDECTEPDMNRSGTQLAFYFMELPDKKSYPSYYTIITKPVCFKQILVSREPSRGPFLTFS